MTKTPIVRTVAALRKKVGAWRKEGKSVALVPTMGSLHEGHLSLVKLARKKADKVIVSIFVNPTQFGAGEDFTTYPRDEKADRDKLSALSIHLIFAPKVTEMYGHGFSSEVSVHGLTEVLCGASRPGHFDGVATVVTKLLLQAAPDIAIFGEKDYQQLLVIRRFVQDLNIPVKIAGGAIVREADGLAMSSRNAYLNSKQRATAPLLNKEMKSAAKKLKVGETSKTVLSQASKNLEKAGFRLDYLEVRHAQTLEAIEGKVTGPARLFAAAFLGKTRLIDNIRI